MWPGTIQFLFAFSDVPCELFSKPAKAYSKEQRNFALTLHLYSPKAYKYLKDKFGFALPDERTLRRYVIYVIKYR